MNSSFLQGLVLAQANGQQAEAPSNILMMLLPWIAIAFMAYFLFVVPHKRRERDMKSMIDDLKENDRVMTIGGIFGVVTNVQRDADRVTIRVDEATGAKIKVGTSAIARVITGEEGNGDKTKKA